MLRIKQKGPQMYTPSSALSMTMDPPPPPPGRKLEDIPFFMRKPIPMDFPDNSHLPEPENAVHEIFDGTPAQIALEFKEKGNKYFKARRWWHAREAYIEGIEFWPDDLKLMEILWLNVAVANIELGKSTKGYYRAARALIHYERYEEAIDCCERALAFDPQNEAINLLLEDPKLGGRSSTAEKVGEIRIALEKAYQHYGLVIILPESTNPTLDIFPYFSPALPNDPTEAPLFCNVTLKYIECHSMDVLVGVKTNEPIGPLLKRCLPGNPRPTGWNDDISFNPTLKGKKQAKKLKQQLVEKDENKENMHPIWDPNDDYTPPNISLYVETYKRQAAEVSAEGTLADTFRKIVASASDGRDGVCLEQGTIFINIFRRGSKVERLWKEGKGRRGLALAQPQYRKNSKEELLAAGQLRTFIIGAPRDRLVDLSLAARGEIVKSADVRLGRETTTKNYDRVNKSGLSVIPSPNIHFYPYLSTFACGARNKHGITHANIISGSTRSASPRKGQEHIVLKGVGRHPNAMSVHNSPDASDGTPLDAIGSTNNQRDTQELTAIADETNETTGARSFVDKGEVVLVLEGQRFIVHAYKIKEFGRINDMLVDEPSRVGKRQAIGLPEKAADIVKVLELLYTPYHLAMPLTLIISMYNTTTPSVDTLVSALSMATKYGHPSLRAYAIDALSPRCSELPPIDRIEVARACNVPEWATGAIDELCEREEPITLEEANRLGVETFGDVSRRREQKSYNQGWKDMGAVCEWNETSKANNVRKSHQVNAIPTVASQPMTYTCSDIRLEGATLHAMTVCSSAKWGGQRKPAWFDLNQVIANDNGCFIWKPQGCFGHSAHSITLQGTRLTADLKRVDGGWHTDFIELDGKFYGLDGVIFARDTPIEV
ncbi:hypothetical protein FRC10_005377 [Ceratobasidium sp. 414]|nr:hypothetical protein FRC10_005377 [Ceratobasidium sp. 414]